MTQTIISLFVSLFGGGFAGTVIILFLTRWLARRDKDLCKRTTDAQADATQQKALKDGIIALLHDRIYAECATTEARGYVDVDGLRNLEYLYTPYHTLGGNGTGTVLYERVKGLPVKPAERTPS